MNRRWVWINLVLASTLYQIIRVIAGFSFEILPIIEAAYWVGFGLSYHWASTRKWA